MRVVVTGGAGFIGSAVVRALVRHHPKAQVWVYDALTYAGNVTNLETVWDRVHFVEGDVRDPARVDQLLSTSHPDAVLHLAAESHVDRSIEDAHVFLTTNVIGTQVLLDAARRHAVQRFVHVSTDEVYGDVPAPRRSRPTDQLAPRSPYAASKAAADHLVLAAHATYGQDVVITRGSNTYGPYQFPEKLIPLAVTNLFVGEDVPVYGDGQQIREWLHVEDHAAGILAAMERGVAGEVYHLGVGQGRTNLEVVEAILDLVGAGRERLRFVADRPGHDRRYALDVGDSQRVLALPTPRPFEDGLRDTVAWYRSNDSWWRDVRSGAYREYYARMVAARPGFRP